MSWRYESSTQEAISSHERLRNHPIFFAGEPDPHATILEKHGRSTIARKFCTDHALWPVNGGPIAPDYNLLENEAAVVLSLIINVKDRRRRIPEGGLSWTKYIGSIMLMREDTKDLTVRQIQALVAFCKHKIDWDNIESSRVACWSRTREPYSLPQVLDLGDGAEWST